jgi:opacity protein-like surface antigen
MVPGCDPPFSGSENSWRTTRCRAEIIKSHRLPGESDTYSAKFIEQFLARAKVMLLPNVLLGRLLYWVVGSVCLSTVLCAQSGESTDTSELSTYGGAGFGAGTSHAWVGGSSGISPSKHFMAVIDTSFLPLGSNTLRTDLIRTTATSRLYDFNFQGQALIPIHHRITPYVLLGAGVLYNTYQVSAVRPWGAVYLTGNSDCKFGFETGGGFRFFATDDFGIRAEYRFTASTQNFNRVLVGVFYQFGGWWPFLGRTRQSIKLPHY